VTSERAYVKTSEHLYTCFMNEDEDIGKGNNSKVVMTERAGNFAS